MKTVTNIIVSVNRPSACFTERFVLPQFRGEMERLYDKSVEYEELLHVPVMTCLDDKMWCNDDPIFLLERMLYGTEEGNSEYKLLGITDEYLYRPWGKTETERVLKVKDGTVTFRPDFSNLTHLNLINVETNQFIELDTEETK